MKALIGFIVFGAIVGGIYALNSAAKSKDGKSVFHVATEPEINVDTALAEQRDIVRTVQSPGAVEAFAEVDISAEVVAKIIEMPVEEGDAVKKGDLLCRLDDAAYRARLQSAEANVAKLKSGVVQTQADLDKAERDFRRQTQLSEADATSAIELADYHTALIRAQTSVDIRKQELIQAEAALQSSLEDLEKTVIRSPLTGIISQRFAKSGEVVVTGTMNNAGTRIMVISDLSKMQVRCRVNESDAPLVKPGQPTRIYLQSDTQRGVVGHVYRVATKGTAPVGRDVVTFETLALVDSDDARVKPGMTVNVEIEVAQSSNAVTIPVQAVVNRKRKDLPKEFVEQYDGMRERMNELTRGRAAEYVPLVWVSEDLQAKPRLVEQGISDDLRVEIIKGVALGDRVITGPFRSLDQLKDGSKLKLQEPEKKEKEKDEKAEGAEETQAKSDSEEKKDATQ